VEPSAGAKSSLASAFRIASSSCLLNWEQLSRRVGVVLRGSAPSEAYRRVLEGQPQWSRNVVS
jgi:hypothetical protein